MKPKHITRSLLLGLLLVALLTTASLVSAQALFGLDWWSVDSGGGLSQGGSYTLHGGIGQPDAAQSQSGSGQYGLSGGFWNGGPSGPAVFQVYLPITLK
jgi:hypothetical protein